uniref:TonB C-terminal domain-containing protein n=1 Tax=Thermodesulfobacterium geofontis TaxID=1295609 RepID=A0A7C4NUF1_9BACT
MFTKYDIFSYFLSILINILFLLVFFSTLNLKMSKEEKIKIKVFSPVESLGEFESFPKKEEMQKEKIVTPYKAISHKEISKENKIFEEKILKERLASIKGKISKRGSESDYNLSEKELKELEERMIAFQKRGAPQNTPFGTSSVGTPSGSKTLGLEYLLLVKRKLQNNFEVPIYLRSQRDLSAIVEMEISSEGKILHYQFIKKSENSDFNKAIERCLKISSPLPVNENVKIIVEFKGEGIGKIR